MKRPIIQCHHCKGQGKLPLGNELWDTLQTVIRLKETDATSLTLAMDWPGHVTAFNNRLKLLMTLGYLKRRKGGKMWLYSLA